MKKNQIATLLIMPALLVFSAVLLHHVHGPYWIGINFNNDPDYLYLINSLALAEFRQTASTGNPGTTLQMMGALIIRAVYLLKFSSSDNMMFSVLKHPELFLTVINVVLVSLYAVTLFFVGYATLSLTKNIWLGIVLQSSPFLSNGMLTHGLLHVSPEPLLIFAGFLLILILLKMIRIDDISKLSNTRFYWGALAIVCGFGVATKITFLPMIIIPFLIISKFKDKISFLIVTVLSLVFWTWPVIPQYKILLDLYCRVITHTGYYGLGNHEWIDFNTYVRNFLFLLSGNPLFFMILLFSASFIILNLRSYAGRKKALSDVSFHILLAVTAAQICAVLIFSKHPAGRYLVPVSSLSGFMLFLIFYYQSKDNHFRLFGSMMRISFFAVILILIIGFRIYDVKNIYAQKNQIKHESLFVYDKMENEFKDHLKIGYVVPPIGYSSHPAIALSFANFFIAGGMYSEPLREIYGELYYYNIFDGKFYSWTKGLSFQEILERGSDKGIVFYGASLRLFDDKLICFDGDSHSIQDLSIENTVLKKIHTEKQSQCSMLNTFIDSTKCGPYKILYLKDIIGNEYETIYILSNVEAVN